MVGPRLLARVTDARCAGKSIRVAASACETTQRQSQKCACFSRRFSALTKSFYTAKRITQGRPAKPNCRPDAQHLKECAKRRQRSRLRSERPEKRSVASPRRAKWRRPVTTLAKANAAAFG